jgi:diaminopimelate epimerase
MKFTKMQGAGNDFVVIDATRQPFTLTPAQMRRLGDRRFGVGCDQILVIEPSASDADFRYRIFNNTGDEVEHCGNGARCFVRYVVGAGLTAKNAITVDTMNRRLALQLQPDGRVSVDMGVPEFGPAAVAFDTTGLAADAAGLWPLEGVALALLSMGNPHAVQLVADVEAAPVAALGPRIERHARFGRGVNAGFMQVLARDRIALRVFERDAGETLACGTGACAAVVAGIRLGLLDAAVEVQTRGGLLRIEWAGERVVMTGPAEKVFDGEIAL